MSRRRAGAAVALALSLAASTAVGAGATGAPATGSTAHPLPADPRALGEALYHGRAPLPGRIRGHDTALPSTATRCINCHVVGPPPQQPASRFGATQTFGPALTGDFLAQPRPRRGGPPSRYDAQALCTLLREGLDPAKVVLPRTMPLYDATPEQCRALWTYLQTVKAP